MIDKDGGGTIDRLEFITFMTSPNGDTSYYDFDIKKMFDQYDINGDGAIDKDEFRIILTSTIEGILKEKTEEGKAASLELIKQLAEAIFSEVDQEGGGELDWNGFKTYAGV